MTTQQFTVAKMDGKKYRHPEGYTMPRGWAIYDTITGQFCALENTTLEPYQPKGGRSVLVEIAQWANDGQMPVFTVSHILV